MKKFLTVLLALSVVFTYSFSSVGAVFAASAEDPAEQALANAKESAVYALEHFVRLSDYDADGQAEVKEIIEEGTTLINLQTDIKGVTDTLSAYQKKLLDVKNADANALAAAKKAAIKSVEEYIALLEDTDAYTSNAFDTYATQAENAINAQASVVGVEFMRNAWYEEIEKVKMKDGSDAEAAKALAKAKADAILVVKGEATTGAWEKIAADKATDNQVKAYKAKVNDVVAKIKAATSEAEVARILDKEKKETVDLAKATELAAAQKAVEDQIFAWAESLDWTKNSGIYTGVKYNVENIYWSSGNALKLGDTFIKVDEAFVTVKDMDDVDFAVNAAKDFLKSLPVAGLDAYKDEYVAKVKYCAGLYKVDDYYKVIALIEDAKTFTEVKDAFDAWRNVARNTAKADATVKAKYDKKVKSAKDAIQSAYDEALEGTELNYDERKALSQLKKITEDDIDSDGMFDNFLKGKNGIEADVTEFAGYITILISDDMTYAEILAMAQESFAEKFDPAKFADEGQKEIAEEVVFEINRAKDIPTVFAAAAKGTERLADYVASAPEDLADRFAAYKKAVAVINALPSVDEITIADKDAVLAAYKTFVEADDKLSAYQDIYGKTSAFVGEKEAEQKILALKKAVETDLPAIVSAFKKDAYDNFLDYKLYSKYSEAQKAELDKIYADALTKMNTAADTGYADGIKWVAKDALAAMGDVVKIVDAEAVAKLIADAKDFLKTTYNTADYNAEQLAEIDVIIATVDGAKSKRDVATLTIAARKAIAKVAEADIVDEDAAKIAAVESLKIKTTTKRYDGKKMLVKWTVSGDASQADGYRIYFSTKKTNSGYKYLAKTTKNHIYHTSIKTNKNVKKGQRVFYRVRAYVEIDGQRYFSDYSTVGNRIWK